MREFEIARFAFTPAVQRVGGFVLAMAVLLSAASCSTKPESHQSSTGIGAIVPAEQLLLSRITGVLPGGWSVAWNTAKGRIEIRRNTKTILVGGIDVGPNGGVMETYCSIDLNIKPFIPLETYQALREQNRAVFARLDDLESQMRDIPRTQAGYAPRTPDQEKRVQDFLAVRGQIQFLPDFYFRDISLEWLGDDTFMRQPRDPAVRAEYQQVAARVKSILTPYPG